MVTAFLRDSSRFWEFPSMNLDSRFKVLKHMVEEGNVV